VMVTKGLNHQVGTSQPVVFCRLGQGTPPPFEGFVKTGPGLNDAWQRIHAGEAVDLLPMCANPSLPPGLVVPRCSRCEVPHKYLAFYILTSRKVNIV